MQSSTLQSFGVRSDWSKPPAEILFLGCWYPHPIMLPSCPSPENSPQINHLNKNSHLRLCFQGTYSRTINFTQSVPHLFPWAIKGASSVSTSHYVMAASWGIHHLSLSHSNVLTTAQESAWMNPTVVSAQGSHSENNNVHNKDAAFGYPLNCQSSGCHSWCNFHASMASTFTFWILDTPWMWPLNSSACAHSFRRSSFWPLFL